MSQPNGPEYSAEHNVLAQEFGVSPEILARLTALIRSQVLAEIADGDGQEALPTQNNPEQRNETIREIATHPNVLQNVFGAGLQGQSITGHFTGEFKGTRVESSPSTPRLTTLKNEMRWRQMVFGGRNEAYRQYPQLLDPRSEPYKALVLRNTENDASLWTLVFRDKSYDDRPGCVLAHHVYLDPELAAKYDPQIEQDPTMMIDIFAASYPHLQQRIMDKGARVELQSPVILQNPDLSAR
ncbi:MAG: hypothetical protein ABWX94_01660 [Candidatus Saccharimonadales bacterium]